MIIPKENRKQLIDFLLRRWRLMADFAALEKVHIAFHQHAQDNNLPTSPLPPLFIPKACRQIEVIKHHIVEILPAAHFIQYDYEAQLPLQPNDFVEVYLADHHQCIAKVEEIVEKMQIT